MKCDSNIKKDLILNCEGMPLIDLESIRITNEDLQALLNDQNGSIVPYIGAFISDFCEYAHREYNATEITPDVVLSYLSTYNKEEYLKMKNIKGISYLIPASKSITFDYYKNSIPDLEEFDKYKIKNKSIYLDY